MRAVKLLIQLTVYYTVLFGGAWLVIHNNPEMQSYLPIGGAEALINASGGKSNAFEAVAQAQEVKTLGQSLGWMFVAILGALITSFPVTWVYMGTRTSDEYDQSIISTILILPSVVTSIVVVVQHSLALAFALGGIAGAVRFKNSLKSSGDALYIRLHANGRAPLERIARFGDAFAVDGDEPRRGGGRLVNPTVELGIARWIGRSLLGHKDDVRIFGRHVNDEAACFERVCWMSTAWASSACAQLIRGTPWRPCRVTMISILRTCCSMVRGYG